MTDRTRRDLRVIVDIATGRRPVDDITEAIEDALDRIGMDEHRWDLRVDDVWLEPEADRG